MTNIKDLDIKEAQILSEEEKSMLSSFDNDIKEDINNPNFDERMDLLLDIPLELTVVLGRTVMTLNEIEQLKKGSLIELDSHEDELVEILLYGKRIAYGKLVVCDQYYGVEIVEITSKSDRLNSII